MKYQKGDVIYCDFPGDDDYNSYRAYGMVLDVDNSMVLGINNTFLESLKLKVFWLDLKFASWYDMRREHFDRIL
jgi:hypothetical protein